MQNIKWKMPEVICLIAAVGGHGALKWALYFRFLLKCGQYSFGVLIIPEALL